MIIWLVSALVFFMALFISIPLVGLLINKPEEVEVSHIAVVACLWTAFYILTYWK